MLVARDCRVNRPRTGDLQDCVHMAARTAVSRGGSTPRSSILVAGGLLDQLISSLLCTSCHHPLSAEHSQLGRRE